MTMRSIIVGDARALPLPDGCAQTIVTSPPYWGGVRDYKLSPIAWSDGWCGQLGHEPTPEMYVGHLVECLEEGRRVLRSDGTMWLNLGDCYMSEGGAGAATDPKSPPRERGAGVRLPNRSRSIPGLKPKDLVGVPWMVAFALRAAGWWLRNEVIWEKPNAQPSPVRDRLTVAHENLFLFSKAKHYYYDAEAIREKHSDPRSSRRSRAGKSAMRGQAEIRPRGNFTPAERYYNPAGRNARTVWRIATQRFGGAHFATMPSRLADRCILAGTSAGGCCSTCGAPLRRLLGAAVAAGGSRNGNRRRRPAVNGENGRGYSNPHIGSGFPWEPTTRATEGWSRSCRCEAGDAVPCLVVDPFAGAGTTILSATRLGRRGVGVEFGAAFAAMAAERISADAPLMIPRAPAELAVAAPAQLALGGSL